MAVGWILLILTPTLFMNLNLIIRMESEKVYDNCDAIRLRWKEVIPVAIGTPSLSSINYYASIWMQKFLKTPSTIF